MILGETNDQKRAQREAWKTAFAYLPVKLFNYQWVFWETYVYRDSSDCPLTVTGKFRGIVRQRFREQPEKPQWPFTPLPENPPKHGGGGPVSEQKKPDIVFCAQAISRIEKGTFFEDYDQASADLGHLRDLLAGYADAALKARDVTVQEAWTVEDVTDHLEDVIGETHDIDVTDRNYAENVVQYLRRHPAALHALAGDDQ